MSSASGQQGNMHGQLIARAHAAVAEHKRERTEKIGVSGDHIVRQIDGPVEIIGMTDTGVAKNGTGALEDIGLADSCRGVHVGKRMHKREKVGPALLHGRVYGGAQARRADADGKNILRLDGVCFHRSPEPAVKLLQVGGVPPPGQKAPEPAFLFQTGIGRQHILENPETFSGSARIADNPQAAHTRPPESRMFCPVIHLAASESRNAARSATYSGLPMPRG